MRKNEFYSITLRLPKVNSRAGTGTEIALVSAGRTAGLRLL